MYSVFESAWLKSTLFQTPSARGPALPRTTFKIRDWASSPCTAWRGSAGSGNVVQPITGPVSLTLAWITLDTSARPATLAYTSLDTSDGSFQTGGTWLLMASRPVAVTFCCESTTVQWDVSSVPNGSANKIEAA